MVRLITDSAADFEPWEYEKYQVECIPLTVFFGSEEYQENINLSKEQFYALVRETGEFPKTAQASPQVLLDQFAQAKEAGDEAIYICLSSALSGTYQTACAAKAMADYDSKNATGGQRMLVEYAVKLRDAGLSAEQIIAAVETLQDKVVLYACMDTMEYLYRGGRISHTVYKLGTLAQVKPIIRVSEEGKVEAPAKAMGMR